MGRPKQYESQALRQKAYRERLAKECVWVERWAWEFQCQHIERLQAAVSGAAERGDPLAKRCRSLCPDTVLERLVVAFEELARNGIAGEGEGP
jgi:hypothetical protein